MKIFKSIINIVLTLIIVICAYKIIHYNNNDIEIELSNGEYLKYKVFSVYITDINDNYTKTSFEDKDEYKEFLERIKNKSIYKSDISVNENDKIITLSTCSYEFDDARLVVTGKLIDKEQ